MFHSPHLLLPLLLLSSTVSGQDDQLTCPDGDLTAYLIALIDTLYWNGLTTFEELIVHLSETDAGYDLLHSLYSSGSKTTILVPTDSAFQQAGIWPPFDTPSSLSNSSSGPSSSGQAGGSDPDDWLVDLLSLHTLQGDWSFDSLPSNGGNGITSTWLSMKDEMNDTSSQSQAFQAVAMRRGQDGASVVIDGWWGNGTTWSGPVRNGGDNGVLDNLVLLPVNEVLSSPPNLSTALTATGLSNFSSALDVVGVTDDLGRLTGGGFTVFVPVDEGWTDDVKAMMNDEKAARALVKSHYSTNYTLYSPAWSLSSQPFVLTLDSGLDLTISLSSDGVSSIVTLGSEEPPNQPQSRQSQVQAEENSTSVSTAKILKSDITLENGVMHVIDTVLVPPSLNASASNTTNTNTSLPSSNTTTTSSPTEVKVETNTTASQSGHAEKAARVDREGVKIRTLVALGLAVLNWGLLA
ncbi:hypothetical protein IAR55_003575 [Kwoniella newhampshirensis]|uniref:FAS1 domain-containing protein n=1 Tax=Kwoniella newhampshirensis TaxID=1651941 RepID=A0AAW0YZC5_9TREE